MGKIRNAKSLTAQFALGDGALVGRGAFDPTLNVDTALFIDPILISRSKLGAFSQAAVQSFDTYFGDIVDLLSASRQVGDAAWREAERRFTFPEIKETCLGYGAGTIAGSALGPALRAKVLNTATEIVRLGIKSPSIFLLIPLLEDGIGPDRISDMTTHAILEPIATYTADVSRQLELPTVRFSVGDTHCLLPVNPFVQRPSPKVKCVDPNGSGKGAVLLLPRDVLRDLPIATDWGEVIEAAEHNDALRRRVSAQIGAIWNERIRTRADKEALRRAILRSGASVEAVLATLLGTRALPYDLIRDRSGVVRWRQVARTVARDYPLALVAPPVLDADSVHAIVRQIIAQYKLLMETRDLWRELWDGGEHRTEGSAQRLFYAVADSYCKANNLDITPEADTGSGVVDFKFASAYNSRVLVEVKLSDNRKLVNGYSRQLMAYRESEQTTRATYLVVNVGGLGDKLKRLYAVQADQRKEGIEVSEIELVNGEKKISASKR